MTAKALSRKEKLRGKKILYLVDGQATDMVARWRHAWPAKHLNDYGIEHVIKSAVDPILVRHSDEELAADPTLPSAEINANLKLKNDKECADYLLNVHRADIDDADIVIFGRTNDLYESALFSYAKSAGKLVGFDVDDLIFTDDGYFAEKVLLGGKSLSDYVAGHVREADFVTVSTPYLRERAGQVRGSDSDIFVLHNRMDLESLIGIMPPIVQEHSGPVRIGWAGGKGHYQKIFDMKQVFGKLAKKYGSNVEFVFKGFNQDNMVTPEEKAELAKFERYMKDRHIKYELHNYTSTHDGPQYYSDLADLKIDIMFAPNLNDACHEAKSELKFIESAFIGAPIVVPAIGGHKHAIRHGHTGMLIEPERQKTGFYVALDRLVSDANLRCRIAERSRQELLYSYNARQSTEQLVEILAQQYEKHEE